MSMFDREEETNWVCLIRERRPIGNVDNGEINLYTLQ